MATLHHAVATGQLSQVQQLLAKKPNLEAKLTEEGSTALHVAVSLAHDEIADELLRHSADVGARMVNGMTPLHIAAGSGHTALANRLLGYGAAIDAVDARGDVPLHHAASRGHVALIQNLLRRGADISARDGDRRTALCIAAESGQTEAMQELLGQRANVEEQDGDLETPLHVASKGGHMSAFQVLVQNGANLNAKDCQGFTPLHSAVEYGRDHVISLLVDRQAFLDSRSNTGAQALHIAASSGSVEAAQLLLFLRANVEAIDDERETALHIAAQRGHAEVTILLFTQRADMEAQNSAGQSALLHAADNGHVEVVDCLLERHAKVSYHKGHALHVAAASGHDAVIHSITSAGNDPNMVTDEGLAALHLASGAGHCDAVNALLMSKADPTMRAQAGETALYIASTYGHVAVVRLLLSSSSNLEAQAGNGTTPLHVAARRGDADLLKLLIEQRADVHAQAADGATALHTAAQAGNEDLANLLIQHGAQLNLRDQQGCSVLHHAVAANCPKLAEALVLAKVEPDLQSQDGLTGLHIAAGLGHNAVVDRLITARVQVNLMNSRHENALHVAAHHGRSDVAERLIGSGSWINHLAHDGGTPLHRAIAGGHTDLVLQLLGHKANPALRTVGGHTALHMVAAAGIVQVAQFLLQSRADVEEATECGATPLLLAASAGHLEVVDALLQSDANVEPSMYKGSVAHRVASMARSTEIMAMLGSFKPQKSMRTEAAAATPPNVRRVEVLSTLLETKGAQEVIVVLGAPTSQKATFLSAAARLLGCEFVDLDESLKRMNGDKSLQKIMEEVGVDAFRKMELEAFTKAIQSQTPRMVASNGGVLETEAGVSLLRNHWPVIIVEREVGDVLELQDEKTVVPFRPPDSPQHPMAEESKMVYERRMQKSRECADFCFPLVRGETDLGVLSEALARLLLQIIGGNTVHLGPDTFMVILTMEEYWATSRQKPDLLPEIAKRADVMEVRVDCLQSLSYPFIAQQIASIRRSLRGTPLLYTVRSANYGGNFAGSEEEYFALLMVGIRLGCELIDVECNRSEAGTQRLAAARGTSLLVGSHFELKGMPGKEELHHRFRLCALRGAAAVVRVAVKGRALEDNWLVQEVGACAPARAFIGVCSHAEGRLSFALNRTLCPVTHPAMPSAQHPELMSVDEVCTCRRTMGLLSLGRQFPIVGAWSAELPRLFSMLQNDVFAALQLPHVSRPHQTLFDEEVMQVLSLASVGGAVAVGPLRTRLPYLLSSLGVQARVLGAVDCIVREENGELIGENSEAPALTSLFLKLGLGQPGGRSRVGLVIGKGTTSQAALLALREVQVERILYNSGDSSDQALHPAFRIQLDRSDGALLGVDISHADDDKLRIERINAGLIKEWNKRNPFQAIQPGDCIVAVNNVRGSVTALVQEINTNGALELELLHDLPVQLAAEPLQDLRLLAELTRVDVVVLGELPADVHLSGVQGSQWLVPVLTRIKPVVVQATWPPEPPYVKSALSVILEAARIAGCNIIRPHDLFYQQVCERTRLWTRQEAPCLPERSSLADVLLNGWTCESPRLKDLVLGILRAPL